MQRLITPQRLIAILAGAAAIALAGCSHNPAPATSDEIKAFAPGMSSLSPEAKAAKEKNDRLAAERQRAVPARK